MSAPPGAKAKNAAEVMSNEKPRPSVLNETAPCARESSPFGQLLALRNSLDDAGNAPAVMYSQEELAGKLKSW